MELSEIRKKIDETDEKLLPLFLERMNLSAEAVKYKKEHSLPILNKTRENEILQRVMSESGDMEQYAHRLYMMIFELSRAYQATLFKNGSKVREEAERALCETVNEFPQRTSVACQGVRGAYSEEAASKMFPRGNLIFFNSFDAVFEAVASGFCRYGVVPVENSSNGSVKAVYDLLHTKNVKIVKSGRLCIRHELIGLPGTKPEDVKEIRSHEQALGQCSEYLKSLGTTVKIQPFPNTATAAKSVADGKDKSVAAIASHSVCELYGLECIAEKIQNSDNNYTRFICISNKAEIFPGANRLSFAVECENKPGTLYSIIAKISALGTDILKLESCPITGRNFDFVFYFEIAASVKDPKIVSMLESLEYECKKLIFLGNYSED